MNTERILSRHITPCENRKRNIIGPIAIAAASTLLTAGLAKGLDSPLPQIDQPTSQAAITWDASANADYLGAPWVSSTDSEKSAGCIPGSEYTVNQGEDSQIYPSALNTQTTEFLPYAVDPRTVSHLLYLDNGVIRAGTAIKTNEDTVNFLFGIQYSVVGLEHGQTEIDTDGYMTATWNLDDLGHALASGEISNYPGGYQYISVEFTPTTIGTFPFGFYKATEDVTGDGQLTEDDLQYIEGEEVTVASRFDLEPSVETDRDEYFFGDQIVVTFTIRNNEGQIAPVHALLVLPCGMVPITYHVPEGQLDGLDRNHLAFYNRSLQVGDENRVVITGLLQKSPDQPDLIASATTGALLPYIDTNRENDFAEKRITATERIFITLLPFVQK